MKIKPYIVAKSAQTLDGKIATAKGQSKWITSKEARDYSRKLRGQFDAIMVGVNTVLKDNPGLAPARPKNRYKKIIIDTKLQIPVRARLFQKINPQNCYIITTRRASKRKVEIFTKRGVNVLMAPLKQNQVSLKWVYKNFSRLGIKRVLIEGGAKLIGASLKENIVDEMHIYIAPKIAGCQAGLSSVQGLPFNNINKTVRLKNLKITKFKQDILVKADVYRNR